MGLTHGFIRIHPETFREASTRLSSPPRSMADALRLAASFSRKLTEFQTVALTEAYDNESSAASAELFEAIVTEEDYSIDKSWRYYFGPVCRQIPSLQGLVDLFAYARSDVPLPSFMKNEAGLTIIWSHRALVPIATSLETITDIPKLRAIARSPKFSLVDRITGRPGKYAACVTKLSDEYAAENWELLRAAICDTVAKQHYLGLSVSF